MREAACGVQTRRENSWLLKLGEVATVEAAEVLAINALAPFALNSKLKPLMLVPEAQDDPKFIVNVSGKLYTSSQSWVNLLGRLLTDCGVMTAMEGKFYRFKTPNHPHTNMAKAALNMMTRTSGAIDHLLKGTY